MHRARAAHVGGIVVHVIEFVWIFFPDAFQRETSEVRGFGLSQRELICFGRLSRDGTLGSKKKNGKDDY